LAFDDAATHPPALYLEQRQPIAPLEIIPGPATPVNKNIVYSSARDTSINTEIPVERTPAITSPLYFYIRVIFSNILDNKSYEYSRDNNNYSNNYNPPREFY
jgi:hypothetical protein